MKMGDKTTCDIIIPVYNKPGLTGDCIRSIRDNTPHSSYNLILIDNGSEEPVKKILKEIISSGDNARIIENKENLGWVKAVNQGLRAFTAPYVCIMNNDTVVRTPGWLAKLIAVARSQPDIGLVNPYFESKGRPRNGTAFMEIDFCRGYCVLIKRSVIDKIGLLDESYGFGYYDDDDYSVRAINAGFRCVRANNVFVEHLRDSTFCEIFEKEKRAGMHEKNKRLFYSRWGRRLKLVFAVTKDTDRNMLIDTLLSAARRQHIVFLWNSGPRVDFNHINIRQYRLPPFLFRTVVPAALFFNRTKRKSRHYDVVFSDDAGINKNLSKIGFDAYCVDMEKDRSRIDGILASAARKQE